MEAAKADTTAGRLRISIPMFIYGIRARLIRKAASPMKMRLFRQIRLAAGTAQAHLIPT